MVNIMKSAGLRIRIEPDLRDAFIQACKERDQSAAQVVRTFIKVFLAEEGNSRQRELFEQDSSGAGKLMAEVPKEDVN